MASGAIKQTTNTSDYGYCKMPDGTLIQWGQLHETVPATSTKDVSVTFPIPFVYNGSSSDGSLNVQVEPYGYIAAVGVDNARAFPLSWDLTKAIIRILNNASSEASRNVTWLAIGRWK